MQKITLNNTLQYLTGLFLFFLPWQTMWITREPMLNGAKWEFGTLGIYASEVLLWGAVVLFMMWYFKKFRIQNSEFKIYFTKDRIFLLAILSLISYLLLSIIWAGDKSIALQHSLHILEAFLLFFILWVGPLSFVSASKWFIGGAVVQSILGIVQFFSQSSFTSKWLGIVSHPAWISGTSIVQGADTGRWLRAYGAFPHPNVLGGYLVVAIVLMLLLYAREKCRNKLSFILPRRQAGIYHLSFIILLTGLFFTFSRSAWIAGIIVLISHVTYHISRTSYVSSIMYHLSPIITVAILITVLSIIFFPLVKTRFVGESMYEIKSTTERISGYSEAWGLFKKHPLRGVGAGNYTVALQTLNPNQPGYVYQPVHNVGALILVELGVVGIGLLVFVLISFIIYHLSFITSVRAYPLLYYSLLFTVYLPLLFFDHYLLSLYVGLMLSAVLWGVGSRFVHELSTE